MPVAPVGIDARSAETRNDVKSPSAPRRGLTAGKTEKKDSLARLTAEAVLAEVTAFQAHSPVSGDLSDNDLKERCTRVVKKVWGNWLQRWHTRAFVGTTRTAGRRR